MRGAILTAAAVAGAIALAGCADEVPEGSEQPRGQPPGTSVPGLPHSGAPKVTTPIADTSRWESDPCSVISEKQLADAGVAIRKVTPDMDSAAGVACDWATEDASLVGGTFITKSQEGLSAIYSNNSQSPFQHFQPIPPIEGQPAVEAMESGTPADGECAISVGLRDDRTFKMQVLPDKDSPLAAEPCKWAATIAGLAVRNMKQGG